MAITIPTPATNRARNAQPPADRRTLAAQYRAARAVCAPAPAGGDLGKSWSSYLVERVEAAENVEVLYHTQIRRLLGDAVLEAVEIENTQTGERRTISTPAVFSFIGAVPRTGWLPAEIETDAKGFIRTGRGVAGSSLSA